MRSLRNIAISSRLWLILLASVLILLTLTGLLLKQHYDDLYVAKEQQTRHVVETAGGILRHFIAWSPTGCPASRRSVRPAR